MGPSISIIQVEQVVDRRGPWMVMFDPTEGPGRDFPRGAARGQAPPSSIASEGEFSRRHGIIPVGMQPKPSSRALV
jgi:hypothetical protein